MLNGRGRPGCCSGSSKLPEVSANVQRSPYWGYLVRNWWQNGSDVSVSECAYVCVGDLVSLGSLSDLWALYLIPLGSVFISGISSFFSMGSLYNIFRFSMSGFSYRFGPSIWSVLTLADLSGLSIFGLSL